MINLRLPILLLLIIIAMPSFASVKLYEVNSQGVGLTLNQAIDDAIIQAIGQINGKAIAAQTEMSLHSQQNSVGNTLENSLSEDYKSKVGSLTKGLIQGYDILSKEQSTAGEWTVDLLVKVEKYESKSTNRKRIAVTGLMSNKVAASINGHVFCGCDVAGTANERIIDHLVQSRKFTILDRDYIASVNQELNRALDGSANTSELVKIGQKLVADYVLTGRMSDLNVIEKSIPSLLDNSQIKHLNAKTDFHYRLIDIASGQIVLSDTIEIQISNNELKKISYEIAPSDFIGSLATKAAEQIASRILDQIYPIQVLSVDGDLLTLAQGGVTVKAGYAYSLYQLAEKLRDPYTKEYIGRKEIVLGKVLVERVAPKMSYARLIDADQIQLDKIKNIQDLIVRDPIKVDVNKPAGQSLSSDNFKSKVSNDDW